MRGPAFDQGVAHVQPLWLDFGAGEGESKKQSTLSQNQLGLHKRICHLCERVLHFGSCSCPGTGLQSVCVFPTKVDVLGQALHIDPIVMAFTLLAAARSKGDSKHGLLGIVTYHDLIWLGKRPAPFRFGWRFVPSSEAPSFCKNIHGHSVEEGRSKVK